MRASGMRRAALFLALWMALCARGRANYYGDPQSSSQWVPKQYEVFHECLRPPCGQGWVAEPIRAGEDGSLLELIIRNINSVPVCENPHESPVWFSGAVDWEKVGQDVFMGVLFAASTVGTGKVKTVRGVDGSIQKFKMSTKLRGNVAGTVVMAGVSIAQNTDSAQYECTPCICALYHV